MNPLMTRVFPHNGNIMQIVNQISQLRRNPNGIADFLRQYGKISNEQYDEIQKMGGDASQIGQYLMQAGAMPQNQVAYAAQTMVPQIQRQM